jgi:hypothetical protein
MKLKRNLMIFVLLGLLTSCHSYKISKNTKLFCSQLEKIQVEGFQIEKIKYDFSIDVLEKIELNNEAIHAWCEYEG